MHNILSLCLLLNVCVHLVIVNNKQLIQTRLLHQSLDSLLCIREVLSHLREQSLPGEREEAILELLRIPVQRLQAVTRQLAARKG